MTEQKEYNSEHLKVKKSESPHCCVQLKLTVLPQATQAAYAKAIKNIGKEVSVRGFRKGKVPEIMLLQRFKKHIDEEFRSIVVNTAVHDAFKLTDCFPYNEKAVKKINVESCSRLEGAELLVEYESYPKIPLINPSEIQVKKVETSPVTEEEIADEINQLAYRFAEWSEVTDRPVMEGDYVDLDIVALDDGERSICSDTRFLVATGRMGEWMHKLVVGMQVGQSVEGMSEKDESEQQKNPHSAPFISTRCRITLKGIKTGKLPEITDEFSTKFGVKTVAELHESIEKIITNRKEREAQEASQALVEKALLEKYAFDLPESLVKAECQARISSKIHDLQHHQNFSQQQIEEQRKEIEAETTKHVTDFLRLEFLIYKLIREKDIKVSNEEVYKEYFNQMMVPPQERLFDLESDKEKVPSILKRIIHFRKALDYILSNANANYTS